MITGGRKSVRGFTLIEILLAVCLLGVFSLIAFRLIGANMHVTEATLAADANTARFDHAVRMLREDVAGSVSIEMPGQGSLQITASDGRSIEWKITGNSLSRTSGAELRIADLGQPLKLKLDGDVVVLSLSDVDQIAMAPSPRGAAR
jgi:prepilin-type N-terminal cleavage/methylation domain-containing protein